MANIVKIKNSNIAGRVPSSLETGELAININDGKLFYKNSSNTIQSISNTGGGGGVTVQNAGSNLGTATTINFTGSGVTASGTGTIEVNVPGGGGGSSPYTNLTETTYSPQANTAINNTNISSFQKINTGEYKFFFTSNFSSNTYSTEINVQSFEDFGEPPNFGIISEKAINYVIVKTGRTNINDINIIDRFDISQFKIKLFE
tara:strand:- start:2487 stop:3095 length:609 start_codon:yes stop_codon:yes gene_type:complete